MLRQRRMLTQKQLAALVGVPYQTVQRWERGASRPRPGNLKRLTEALGVGADELLGALGSDGTGRPIPLDQRTYHGFWDPTPSWRELAERQGVKPFDVNRFREARFWPEDEDIDEFLATLREWRNEGLRH
jgi:transcriptional regulator with XRE-family HTH domain